MKHKTIVASLFTLLMLSGCRNSSASNISSSLPDSSEKESSASSSIALPHTIKGEATLGGSLSLDKENAKRGETVTLTVTALENHIFNKFTASPEITFTTIEEGKTYSFIMPDENVSIKAEFVGYNSLTLHNVSPDFLEVIDEEGVFSKKHKEGDEVYFELKGGKTLSEGIKANLLEHIYVHAGNTVIRPKFATGGDATGLLPVSFTMPADAEDVFVVYSVQQHEKEEGHKITLQAGEGFTFLGVTENTKYDYLDSYIHRKDGYKLTTFQWKYDNEEEWHNIENVAFDDADNANFSIRPTADGLTSDITIKAEGEYVGSKKITFVNEADVVFYKEDITGMGYLQSDIGRTRLVGETYEFYFKPISSKHIKSVTFTGVETTAPSKNSYGFYHVSFEMPDNDVTITFNAENNFSISVTANENVETADIMSGYKYDSYAISSIAPGETFYVKATAKKGYRVTGGKLNGGDLVKNTYLYDRDNEYYTWAIPFVMPETGNALITLETEKVYAVSVDPVDNVEFALDGRDSFAEGTEVGFDADPGAFYDMGEVEVYKTGDENTKVAVTKARFGTPKYKFTMPAYDVTIKVNKTKKETKTVSLDFSGIDSTILSDVSITTSSSYQSLNHTPTNPISSITALSNEKISLRASITDVSKDLVLEAVYDTETKTTEPAYYSFSNGKLTLSFNGIKAEAGLKSIKLKTVDMKSSAVTLQDKTDNSVTLSYQVNGEDVTALPSSLYYHQSLTLTVTPKDQNDSNIYSVYVNGNRISKNWDGDYEIEIDGETTSIEIQKKAGYKFEVVCDDSIDATIKDDDYNDYTDETTLFEAGSEWSFVLKYWDEDPLDITVEVNGVKDATLSKTNVTSFSIDITFNANYKITISLHQ